MSLDDTVNLERLATAFEKIAAALENRNRIELDRLGKQYPPEREKRAAEIIRPDDERRQQFSDRASPEWIEETENALPQKKSRFEEKFESTGGPKPVVEKKRRAVEVPKTQ